MRIECITQSQNNQVKPAFKSRMKTLSLDELCKVGDRIYDCFEREPQRSAEELRALGEAYRRFKYAQSMEYLDSLSPRGQRAANKILALEGYENLEQLAGSFLYYKPKELEDIYSIVSPRDISGEMRYEGVQITTLFGIAPERLKIFKPIILSKNDLGLWNYDNKFIRKLDGLADRPLEVISKLTDCKILPESLLGIVSNPHLNWEKTVQKAQSIKKLFGDDLREIAFLSNRYGDNFLSVDVQQHNKGVPAYQDFKRLYAMLDDDVNPIKKLNANSRVNQVVENIYSTLEKKLNVFTEKDLDNTIKNVMLSIPNSTEQEVLTVMQRLTQFANYSAIPKLSKELQAHNIGNFYELGGINPSLKYLFEFKGLGKLEDDIDKSKTAFVIDKTDLGMPERILTAKEYGPEKLTFINLEGWNEGVSFISDDAKLQKATIKVLKKAKEIMQKDKDLTLDEAIGIVLNRKYKAFAKKAGIEIATISLDAPATKSVVLDQMRPLMPTQSLLKSTIESISKHYSKNDSMFEDFCMRIAKYYEENLNVYSKQSIIENLKNINTQINKFLKENNLSRENVYFVKSNLPACMVKSFDLINKMNADLHNIPSSKNIKLYSFSQSQRYPEGSTFVILDDVVGSGASMSEMGEYMFAGKKMPENQHVLFCPITATKEGLDFIQAHINGLGRQNIDKIIIPIENTKDYSKTYEMFAQDSIRAKMIFGESGLNEAGMCTAFPYMTPDNNSALAGYLTKFFLPDSKCIKTRDDLLPIIEEETFYYDIFGTDKANVITDGMKIFHPTPNMWKSMKMKMIELFLGGNE